MNLRESKEYMGELEGGKRRARVIIIYLKNKVLKTLGKFLMLFQYLKP